MGRESTSAADVQGFLRRFQQAVDEHGIAIWRTEKNDRFLLDTGFTNADVEAVIRSLRPRDYSSGPEPDDDPGRPPGEVWKFFREYEGFEMYVKLKLDDSTGLPVAECLSFHQAERPMRQPHLPKR